MVSAVVGGTRPAWTQAPSSQTPSQAPVQGQAQPPQGRAGLADEPAKSPAASEPPSGALDFVGSYSAPSAVSTTETGHVSAHPPSPPPGRRLRRAEVGPSLDPPWRDHHASPGPTSPATSQLERDQLWSGAIRAWQAGDLIQARDTLARLAKGQPDEPGVWFLLGSVALDESRATSRHPAPPVAPLYERRPAGPSNGYSPAAGPFQGRLRPALQQDALELVAELERLESIPDSSDVLERRFRAALALSDTAYRRAAVSPLYRPYVSAIHALATEESGDAAAAERGYHDALNQDPTSAVLHAGLGHLLRAGMRLRPAQEELARAEALDPSDPEVAFELGDVDQRLGDPAAALPLLDRALELDPQLVVVHWSRAKAYLALGDEPKALADLESAAPADSTGEVVRQLVRLYRKMGREDLARQAEQLSERQRRTLVDKQAPESKP